MIVNYTMNLVKSIEQYNNNNLIFCEPIKNNIMNDGNFIRILYSTDIITFNGIYLLINLSDCSFDKFYNSNKVPLYKIYEQVSSGFIKIYSEISSKSNHLFILKISGIWETPTHYGLTYKFIKTN